MQDSLEPIFIEEKKKGGSNISAEKTMSKVVANWPLFVLCIVICLSVAYVYLRYATPKYKAEAKILIKDKADAGLTEGQLFDELGMQGSNANVENEVEIMKSRTIMKQTVANSQAHVHYYAPGRIKTSEYYYKELPFRLVTINSEDINLSTGYKITLKGDAGYKLTYKKKTWENNWGDTIELPTCKAVLYHQPASANPAYVFESYNITIKPVEWQAIRALKALDIKQVNNKSSIIDLAYSDALPLRAEDMLNELIDVYLKANIDDRVTTMQATVKFIDNRLVLVTDELGNIEKNLEHFKSERKLTDLSEQSKMLIDYSTDYAKQITEREVQLRVIESLEEYLADDANKDKIVPSSLLVRDDASLASMEAYNDLQLKRAAMLMTRTENNLVIKNLDTQLETIRDDLVRSLSSMKKSVVVSINELKKKSGDLDNEIRKVPENERIFLEYTRQQHIKQELYLFLLKKREETAISKSTTLANARVIDPARTKSNPYAPQKSKIYLAAFVLGLFFPGMYLFVREQFNVKVTDKIDITGNISAKIIGEIGHKPDGSDVVVLNDSKTVIAEQFRSLRTNLQFLLTDKQHKTVLVTSSMSGEGKSFVALNLAISLSLSGEKVVLLELDLRKPKISANLNLRNSIGFTGYMAGKADIDNIITPSGLVDTLSIIPSGAIPPNPSELMLSPKVKDLFDKLKNEYDYVIIDSAPVGLVTDAQLLGKHADTTLYICRMNFTRKEQLSNADELYTTGKIKPMSIVANDVKGNNSAYGYGGYGNDDYFEGKRSKGLKNIMSKMTGRS
ncbi:MAG: polysaccharide biosynthesis tyrosine autokinase [Chitinophagales bacterium]|nr:polysaccharide biosynthesis tyrosine autokinase [Chitinophagaceae bacterium]MCB9065380.1 polysaccharide biosynthesis tyrosine autokinase [Chitinophagales bacterium]